MKNSTFVVSLLLSSTLAFKDTSQYAKEHTQIIEESDTNYWLDDDHFEEEMEEYQTYTINQDGSVEGGFGDDGIIYTEKAKEHLLKTQGRTLYEQFLNPKTKSNNCKSKCIDIGLIYCANANYSGGYCCDLEEACPRAEYCSNDNPRAPTIFNYQVCPNEAACEGKKIYPKYNGEVLTRAVDKYTYSFVQNDVCGYIISSPWEMQPWDRMRLRISKIENAVVYVAKGRTYKWLNHLDQLAGEGSVYNTRAGWQFYVVGVAQSVFRGSFRMQIWVELGEEPKKAEEKEPMSKPTPKPVVVKEKVEELAPGVKKIPTVISGNTADLSKKDDPKSKLVTKEDIEAIKIAEIKAENSDVTDEEIAAIIQDKDVQAAITEAVNALNSINQNNEEDPAETYIQNQTGQDGKSGGSVITFLLIACVMFVSFLGFVAYIIKTKEGQKKVLSISMGDQHDQRNGQPNAGETIGQPHDSFNANDLLKKRQMQKNNWDQMPEGLSDIDSVNDTKSLNNRTQFTAGNRTNDEKTSNYNSNYNTSNMGISQQPGLSAAQIAPDAMGNFTPDQMAQMFALYKQIQVSQPSVQASMQNTIESVQHSVVQTPASAVLPQVRSSNVQPQSLRSGGPQFNFDSEQNIPQTDDEQIKTTKHFGKLQTSNEIEAQNFTDVEGDVNPNQERIILNTGNSKQAEALPEIEENKLTPGQFEEQILSEDKSSRRGLIDNAKFGADIGVSSSNNQQSEGSGSRPAKKKKKKKVKKPVIDEFDQNKTAEDQILADVEAIKRESNDFGFTLQGANNGGFSQAEKEETIDPNQEQYNSRVNLIQNDGVDEEQLVLDEVFE